MSARPSLLRELFKASKRYVRDRPPLKWAFRVLYWSPLCMAFVHYGYTVKYVSGKSMQVRNMNVGFRLSLFADALHLECPAHVEPRLLARERLGPLRPRLNQDTSRIQERRRSGPIVRPYSVHSVRFRISSLTLTRFVSSPINPRLMLVKRIIALPGDTVRVLHHKPYGRMWEF